MISNPCAHRGGAVAEPLAEHVQLAAPDLARRTVAVSHGIRQEEKRAGREARPQPGLASSSRARWASGAEREIAGSSNEQPSQHAVPLLVRLSSQPRAMPFAMTTPLPRSRSLPLRSRSSVRASVRRPVGRVSLPLYEARAWVKCAVMALGWLGAGSRTRSAVGAVAFQSSMRSRWAEQSVVRGSGAQSRGRPS